MTKNFKVLTLLALAAGSIASAQAAAISFETLAAQALGSGPPPYGTPTPLNNQIPGLIFTGAAVYHEQQTTRAAGYCCTAPADNVGVGFVQNRKDYSPPVNESISVQLDRHPDGNDIESIRFDIATSSTDMEFYAVDTAAGKSTRFDFTPSTVEWAWVGQTLDFSSLGVIDRIEFKSLGGANVAFALDNLDFTFARNGGAVPEPTGMGLVVLALAAAGAASRRRGV